jgi:hypothetical protein
VLKDPKSFAVVTDALRACTAPSSSSSALAPQGPVGTGNRRMSGQQHSASASSAGLHPGIGSVFGSAEGGGSGEDLKLGVWVALRQLQRASKALNNMALFKGTSLQFTDS